MRDGLRRLRANHTLLAAIAFTPLLVLAFVAAFRGGGGEAAAVAIQETDSELRGTVEVDGSSTVFPITEAIAERFGRGHPNVRVTVGVSGTGGGFKRFCRDETEISNASRPITQSEIELCADSGIDFVEVPVAFDGLTIAVNLENDWVDVLSVEELEHIFRPQNPAQRWSDVREGWPDLRIVLFSPGADSGTFDYFTETVNGEAGRLRASGTTFSEDDNVLVIGVDGERGGIGYFGFSYFINNRDRLRGVPIVNRAGTAVGPSLETINDGSYNPLSRPLFIYVKVSALEQPAVLQFVEFYLTDGRSLIDSPEVGYVQLPDALYETVLRRVHQQRSGSPIAMATEGKTLIEIYEAG